MERGTPPPARVVASLDSSSSWLLDLVVVLLLLDLVLLRLLLRGARPEAWRGRGAALGAVDLLEILRRGSTLALASSKFFGVSSAL